MISIIIWLLINLTGGMALGYNFAPLWFGLSELIGIAALVGCVSLPYPTHIVWLKKLRVGLFIFGGLLTVLSILTAASTGFNHFIGWFMVLFFWMTLNLAAQNLEGTLNYVVRGFLLYASAGLGLGLGYLGSTY
ncbi:hypothetical protein HRE53_32050 (plasmid) [Acaryochloris sp. 'Moss Beach']|uniref:hypothetical protein n=1 Tax=Acaryochloris sp. 'Moss Beach' TaxID=2740837 RepID=UPI001F1585C0|nr:hypothetical protein [Acaryochloris sp. 'Moss Beach']UJB73204.1 hypothetical protein HRE53_32050 [Acaryochloris sp. 'Moss Beach']